MKKKFILRTVLMMAISLMIGAGVQAQEKEKNETIAFLKKQIEAIDQEERELLRKQIEGINGLVESAVISFTEAEKLKLKAAEKTARSIEQRKTVILETIDFLQKDDKVPSLLSEKEETLAPIGQPQTSPPGNPVVAVEPEPSVVDGRQVRKTTLDLVFAGGFSTASSLEGALNETTYDFSTSNFFEAGLTLKSALVNKGGLRLKYGVSFQFNDLSPNNDHYFTENDLGQVVLADFGSTLHKSRYRNTNVVIPIHFELGPTKKKYTEDGNYYYSSGSQFKIGFGGYAGWNIRSDQLIEYTSDSFFFFKSREVTTTSNIDASNYVYGLSAYIGVGAFSIYAKHDLNPIFQHSVNDENFTSFGLRIDL